MFPPFSIIFSTAAIAAVFFEILPEEFMWKVGKSSRDGKSVKLEKRKKNCRETATNHLDIEFIHFLI